MLTVAHRLCTATLLITCGSLLGCSEAPELAPVSGTVLLDGKPLADALVLFTPVAGGRPSAARTSDRGEYELVFTQHHSGALLGEHLVRISTFQEGDPDNNIPSASEKVPPQYNAQSKLSRFVEQESNSLNFELKSRDVQLQPRFASRRQ